MARERNPFRDLDRLERDARSAADTLESLQHQIGLRRLTVRVVEHRARFGERAPLVDLGEAARTLRAYAGFLELMISAAKRQTEPQALAPIQ